jgi:hypothetical protein
MIVPTTPKAAGDDRSLVSLGMLGALRGILTNSPAEFNRHIQDDAPYQVTCQTLSLTEPKAMINSHTPLVDLEACQMDAESVNTLSYIFCQEKQFESFTGLYTWFMAGLPDSDKIGEFWDEVEDLGWV